jgi:molybdate transport system ATP-binding protein
VIPPQYIVLHRPDRPTRGGTENPVAARLTEVVALGGVTSVTAAPVHAPDQPLSFAIPTHAARRSQLAAGVTVTLSLLAEGIHLLPYDPEA